MITRPLASTAALFAVLLAAPLAWADRIALLPSRGGADPAARVALDGDLGRSLAALGHTLVPAPEVSAAITTYVTDGVADTTEEYRAVGAATHADWVLVGSVEPAVTTERVELVAALIKAGRVESVAREVEKARAQAQIQEMLAVLVRPEGIGAGALPWERINPAAPPPAPPAPPPPVAPPPAPPAPPPPPAVPPVDGRAHVNYPLGASGDTWPPYSGGKRGFIGATIGFALPAVRPSVPAGVMQPKGTSFTGAVRGGVAVTDLGLEPFAELGGNLAGPRALWLAAGARWMFSPALSRGADGVLAGAPFYIGPEILVGGFFQLGANVVDDKSLGTYTSGTEAHPMLGAALDLAYALSPSFQLEMNLGNLRWVPVSNGSILVLGATLGASVRF
ncbi:Hypothetical protein A7982_09272 [Minicystis rosea]|nr:Hypothetical protein A7982_09272 [Minicystis rosea]